MGILDFATADDEGFTEFDEAGAGADFARGDGAEIVEFHVDGGGLALTAEVADDGDADGGVDEGGGGAAVEGAEDVVDARGDVHFHGEAVLIDANDAEAEEVVKGHPPEHGGQLGTGERPGLQNSSMAKWSHHDEQCRDLEA